jgi:hypothetical protein
MSDKLIATWLTDPSKGIFKPNKNKDRAAIHRIYCSLEGECPALAQGKCIHRGWLEVCVYGKQSNEEGPTMRSKSHLGFIARGKQVEKETPDVSAWPRYMLYVGEYVYLPYPYIDLTEGSWEPGENGQIGHHQAALPLYRSSHLFQSGIDFMKRELFDVEMVWRIVCWRPQAMMGGEIKDYQTKSVPQFLHDLRAVDRPLYEAAVAKYPAIADRIPDNKMLLGKQTTIGSLPSGKIKHHSHIYIWDASARTMTTTEDPIIMTPDPLKIVVYPHPDLKVELCDPEMVNSLPDDFVA